MIESFIDLKQLRQRPFLTFFWAMLLNSVAIIITSQIQTVQAGFGMFAVLFTIIPSVFFLTLLIKQEERREEKGGTFWDIHGEDILILLLFFFGLTISFALWTALLPQGTFDTQISKIAEIRGTGAVALEGAFLAILQNNLQVMAVSFILSFIFGAGAIFILVWNASVLGVYIGQASQSLLHIPVVSLGFLPHGIPEIGGYVVAGLAGGILSAAILRKREDILLRIFWDSVKLMVLATLLIALGAGIEVFL